MVIIDVVSRVKQIVMAKVIRDLKINGLCPLVPPGKKTEIF